MVRDRRADYEAAAAERAAVADMARKAAATSPDDESSRRVPSIRATPEQPGANRSGIAPTAAPRPPRPDRPATDCRASNRRAAPERQSGVRGCRPTGWTPVRETYGVAHDRGSAGAELEVRSIPLDLVGPVRDVAVLTDQASARLAGLAPGPGEPAALMGGAGVARAGPDGVSTWVGTVGATMVTIVMRGDPAETTPVWESLDAATG